MTFVVDRGSHKARLRADFRSPVSEQRTSASCIPYFIETHLQASGKRSSSFIVDANTTTHTICSLQEMAAYQHWTSSVPLRHPWFDAQTTKRKHLDDAVDGTETDVRSSKKPRCSVLERGFANLSLDNGALTNVNDAGYSTMEDITLPLNVLPPSSDLQPFQIIRPSSIEEPDIKMESSWSEPEPDRIIVTDLDGFTEEDEGEGSLKKGGELDEAPSLHICINPTLLDHIWRDGLKRFPQAPTQALVLYQPLLQQEGSKEDDAMDVEA